MPDISKEEKEAQRGIETSGYPERVPASRAVLPPTLAGPWRNDMNNDRILAALPLTLGEYVKKIRIWGTLLTTIDESQVYEKIVSKAP